MKSRSFYVMIVLLGLALTGVFAMLENFGIWDAPASLYASIPGFAILTIILYRSISRAAEKSPQRFIVAFMAAVLVKLMLTASFIGIFVYIFPEYKISMALGVFMVYIAYTVLMARALIRSKSTPPAA